MTICMLAGTVNPFNSFAESNEGLEQAIKVAKQKFNISKHFTDFNYDVHTDEDQKIWTMHWKNKKDEEISVSIKEDGEIVYYSFYKNNDAYRNKIPKYDEKKAKEIAERFIKKIDDTLLQKLQYQEEDTSRKYSTIGGSHEFYYNRIVNGIPFYGDHVRVSVNGETGEVENYHCNFTNQEFPQPKDIISLEEAKQNFKKELGLKLVYRYRKEKETIKPYLVYVTKYDSSHCIDAFTGKKVELGSDLHYYKGEVEAKVAYDNRKEIGLSPEEIKAVKEVSNIRSKEDVEKISRNTRVLGLDSSFELSNGNLHRDWLIKKDFVWNLYFTKEGDKAEKSVSVSIDGVTGEIRNFSIYDHSKKENEGLYDEDTMKKEADEFLKSFVPDQFCQTVYEKNEYNREHDGKKPLSYTFTYRRHVNNVPFENNYIRVTVDAGTKKIKSFYMGWYDIEFPTAKNVVSMDQIYNKLFHDIGLQLQYKKSFNYEETINMIRGKSKIKLVYALNNNKPAIFDGNSGKIVDHNGKPYKEEKKLEYIDIKGHDAQKEIEALAQYGIGFKEESFHPDKEMNQKDFFRLFVKALDYYGEVEDDEEAIEAMYKFLMRREIVNAQEKSPNNLLNKEDAAKFIVRALNYDEVANIQGIYKYPFKDIDQTTEGLRGYITIANGLGIIKGNNELFEPKKNITRGEGAVIIYNYLNK